MNEEEIIFLKKYNLYFLETANSIGIEKQKLFGLENFNPKRPGLVLTFEEALDRGLDPYSKGYYVTIHKIRVPLVIFDCTGQRIISPTTKPILILKPLLSKIKNFFKSFHW